MEFIYKHTHSYPWHGGVKYETMKVFSINVVRQNNYTCFRSDCAQKT